MINMLNCDVLVIGAGVSGSTTSLMLSKSGYNVITVEKSANIGGFTNHKLDITESKFPDGSDLKPILKELHIEPYKKFNVSRWCSRNESFTLKTDIYDYYFKRGTSENSLECQLIKKAIEKGCKFFPNIEVKKFDFKDGNIKEVVLNKKGKKIIIKPKIIIGADGSYSICRKLSAIKEIKSNHLEGFGIRFKNHDFKDMEVVFDSDFAPGGYIYCGSVKDEGMVGIMIDKLTTKKSSREIFELNKKKNIYFKKFENIEFLNSFEGFEKYGIVEEVVKGNLLLVGGAGLLINPFMGYGVNYAIKSGYEVSIVISNNLSKGKSLNEYREFYNKSFLPYFNNANKSRNIFKKLNNKDLDFIIRSLGKITEKNAKDLTALIEIIKAKPTSIKALRTLYRFSKILY